MILGFSHISYVVAEWTRAEYLLENLNYVLENEYPTIAEAPEKSSLANGELSHHTLRFYKPEKDEGPRIEVIELPKTVGENKSLSVRNCSVIVKAQDPFVEEAFLVSGLGYRFATESFLFESAFPEWNSRIILEGSEENTECFVDSAGFSTLAFYSSSPEKDAEKLVQVGGRDATRPFRMQVGNRMLKIVMLRTPSGLLIELIKIEGNYVPKSS